MRDYINLKVGISQSIRVIIIIIFTSILFLVIIPWKTAANPVAIYDRNWEVGENILRLFFANLILDGLIFLIPLFILSKIGFEKKISELWVFGVPLLAIWGAYIDTFYANVDPSLKVNQLTGGFIIFILCLLLIFCTFILVIHFLIGHRIITGMIIGVIAVIINGIFWMLHEIGFINYYSNIFLSLVYLGVFASIILLLLMINYIVRKYNQKRHNDLISRSDPYIAKNLLRAQISFFHIFFLFSLAFFMMLYPL